MLRQIALIKPPRFSRNGSWQNNKKRKKEMITAFLASDLAVIEKEGRWHRQWCIRPSSHSALGNGSRLVWEARKKCNQSFYILTWERENNCGRRRKPAYTLLTLVMIPGCRFAVIWGRGSGWGCQFHDDSIRRLHDLSPLLETRKGGYLRESDLLQF